MWRQSEPPTALDRHFELWTVRKLCVCVINISIFSNMLHSRRRMFKMFLIALPLVQLEQNHHLNNAAHIIESSAMCTILSVCGRNHDF